MKKQWAAILWIITFWAGSISAEIVRYDLDIRYETVNITGKPVRAMTIAGQIPAPLIEATVGDTLQVTFHNKLDEETIIHWHGVLVPNNQDGVSYLTTAPILPGRSYTYEFTVPHSGTFWYHSHAGFQIQRGVFGPLVFHPKNGTAPVAAKDAPILFSDWTDELPEDVFRNLKRDHDYYSLKKGTVQSWDKVLARGWDAIRTRIVSAWNRMPPMDISDVGYDAFLTNGQRQAYMEDVKPGDKVRLRLINAGQASYFFVEFAGGPMTVISVDGKDIQPVNAQRLKISNAETYDILVTLPHNHNAYELRATAEDGTGFTSLWLGHGPKVHAPDIPRPELIMTSTDHHAMAEHRKNIYFSTAHNHEAVRSEDQAPAIDHDEAGAQAHSHAADAAPSGHLHAAESVSQLRQARNASLSSRSIAELCEQAKGSSDAAWRSCGTDSASAMPPSHSSSDNATAMMHHQGMVPGHDHHSDTQQTPMHQKSPPHSTPDREENEKDMGDHHDSIGHASADETREPASQTAHPHAMPNQESVKHTWPQATGYAGIKSMVPTALNPHHPVRNVHLRLTDVMERFVWSLNDKPLSEADKIVIKKGEVVRFIMTNETMMNHPMHLHGHFFRVLNGEGDYSPLKHTVDVPMMDTIVIEFAADEEKDWLFHCHNLYHMMAGMGRVVRYGNNFNPETGRMFDRHAAADFNRWFAFLDIAFQSHMTDGLLKLMDNHHDIELEFDYNYRSLYDIELSVERRINRFLGVYIGGNLEKEKSHDPDNVAVIGVRYLLPLLIESDLRIDTKGRVRLHLENDHQLTDRLNLAWKWDTDNDYHLDLTYEITKAFGAIASYDSDYDAGGGIWMKF